MKTHHTLRLWHPRHHRTGGRRSINLSWQSNLLVLLHSRFCSPYWKLTEDLEKWRRGHGATPRISRTDGGWETYCQPYLDLHTGFQKGDLAPGGVANDCTIRWRVSFYQFRGGDIPRWFSQDRRLPLRLKTIVNYYNVFKLLRHLLFLPKDLGGVGVS